MPQHEQGDFRRISASVLSAPEADIALAAACFVALLIDPLLSSPSGHIGIAAIVLAAVTASPLTVRRRYPLSVLGLVIAGDLACLAVFRPKHAAVAVAMIALYNVGLQGQRRSSLIVGAAMVPGVAAAASILHRTHLDALELVAYFALLIGALVAGDARRGRLALARASVERAKADREAAARHRFDEQRLQIAHELHDSIGHALVAVNVRAAAAAHSRRNDPDESLEALEEIKRTSADALAELRSTLKMLRSGPDEAPLRPRQTLEGLGPLVEGLTGVGITVNLKISGLDRPIPEAVEHAAYRIIQEAFTNVLRHSDASAVVVNVSVIRSTLRVEVIDDGSATSAPNAVVGHGLKGMKERAEALQGCCQAGANPTGGWRVLADLPTT